MSSYFFKAQHNIYLLRVDGEFLYYCSHAPVYLNKNGLYLKVIRYFKILISKPSEKQNSPSSIHCLAYCVTLILHVLSHVNSKQPSYVSCFPFKGEIDDSQLTHLGTKTYSLMIISWIITQQ